MPRHPVTALRGIAQKMVETLKKSRQLCGKIFIRRVASGQ
jgi:hypothetical protein